MTPNVERYRPFRRWPHIVAALAALVALGALSQPASAAPLGRLFFTPDERVLLDRQRKTGKVVGPVGEGASIAVGGIVTRSSGRRTIWINDRPVNDPPRGEPAGIRPAGNDSSIVEIAAQPGATARVKVGESVNIATGQKQDRLSGGRVVAAPANGSK